MMNWTQQSERVGERKRENERENEREKERKRERGREVVVETVAQRVRMRVGVSNKARIVIQNETNHRHISHSPLKSNIADNTDYCKRICFLHK
jgi:hypothetical protein